MTVKELLRRLRDFVMCCKKAINKADSVLDEMDWLDSPIYKPKEVTVRPSDR